MSPSLRSRVVLPLVVAGGPPLLALEFLWSRDLRERARVELAPEQANLAEPGSDDFARLRGARLREHLIARPEAFG